MEIMVKELKDQRQTREEDRAHMHRQMLSSISHDLKTPLASIIGSLEIYHLLETTLPETKKAELLKTALQESYRLDSFITNILDMAKFEGGIIKIRKELTDIPAVLQQCIRKIRSQTPPDATITLSAPSHLDWVVDSTLFSRAIGLLLDNAVKYGPRTGLQIDLSCKIDNDVLILDIKDNGLGIPENRKEEIFNKYTRLAKEDTSGAGTGLGLAIARMIIDLMQGSLHVSNDLKGGAIFRFAIPKL